MKKLIIGVITLSVAASSMAALVDWSWSIQSANFGETGEGDFLTGPPVSGDTGKGWMVEVSIVGTNAAAPETGALQFGWFGPASAYRTPVFNATVTEGTEVALTLFNAADKGAATWFIQSAPLMLPDYPDSPPPSVSELQVTFDVSSAAWEVVPEPATIGLMGIAGLGMYLARRKVRS